MTDHLRDALPRPVLLLGAYGYRNVGDEAILAGLLARIGREQVTAVSRSPAETTALHAVYAVGPTGALAGLRRHRSLLIGGGGLFGADMGLLGRGIAGFGLLAAASGLEVAIEAVGADPALPWSSRVPLRLLGPRLASCTVRDGDSAETLRRVGMSARIVDDASSSLEPAAASEARALLRAAGVDGRRPVVGLALTGLGSGARAGGARSLVDAVRHLSDALPDVQLCFIPMSQHPFVAAHNDLLLAGRLHRAVPRLAVVEGLHPPARILALFGLLSAVVGMRYHALLFAHRWDVPLVAVPYARKCDTWIADHGGRAVEPDGPALAEAVREALGERLAWTA
jgi:polysaccharide pyruvyl transferase WcaK-like protein